ncbi:BamA/TamA family outer membrane protein [Mucilaginibacter roseus]|uniref:BamA/TamA family outer membrane protein n=1 Tax=Mucilaginibacter roseus TaxID=1528868 RepID=A0ABS8U0H0_9SPHI|nr:BamA/TamA family outer membrane protein [Mucilaginibacter roseus]MCD8739352.1 BamA/TamA family outer membrane protein [Mucilaginibacter roseus]
MKKIRNQCFNRSIDLLKLMPGKCLNRQWLNLNTVVLFISLILPTLPAMSQQKQYFPNAVNVPTGLMAITKPDSIVIIDVTTNRKFYSLESPGQSAKYIAFNSSGTSLICGDENGRTILYTISREKSAKAFELPVKTVAAVFDRTGNRLYVVHSKTWVSAKLSLVELPRWKILKTISVPSNLNAIDLNADGSTLAYTIGQNIVEIDPGNLKTIRSHWERSTQQLLVYHPFDVKQSATTTGQNVIQIRDLTGDSVIVEIYGHQKKIKALSYNSDGSSIYSLDESGELNGWSLADRQRVVKQSDVRDAPYWDKSGTLKIWQNDRSDNQQSQTAKAVDSVEHCCFVPAFTLPFELIPQPVLTYTPETGFMIGLNVTLLKNDLAAPAGAPYRPSMYSLSTAYGFGGKQWRNSFSINNYSPKGWHVVAQIQYNRHDKNYYFGIGPNVSRKNRESYVNNNLTFSGSVAHFLSKSWSFGLKYELSNYTAAKFDNSEVVLPFGTAGGFLTGLGPTIQYDNRNDILFPTKGSFMELNFLKYGLLKTGRYAYNEVQFDYRKYFSIGGSNGTTGFALQAYADAVWGGNVPFYKLPYFTFDRSFRGMWRNLYINQQVATVQAEFRSLFDKANPRLGYVLFASAADGTANFFKGYKADIKFAFGGGLRSQLLPKKRIYARIDYSFSNKGDYGIFGGIGTAF